MFKDEFIVADDCTEVILFRGSCTRAVGRQCRGTKKKIVWICKPRPKPKLPTRSIANTAESGVSMESQATNARAARQQGMYLATLPPIIPHISITENGQCDLVIPIRVAHGWVKVELLVCEGLSVWTIGRWSRVAVVGKA